MTAPVTEILQDADLEAWFQGEVERPCESVLYAPHSGAKVRCPNTADWLIYATSDCLGAFSRLICDSCKEGVGTEYLVCCEKHLTPVTVTWVERTRGAV